jgi:hypothetical protein
MSRLFRASEAGKTEAPQSFPLTFDTLSVYYQLGKPAQSFRAVRLAYGFAVLAIPDSMSMCNWRQVHRPSSNSLRINTSELRRKC